MIMGMGIESYNGIMVEGAAENAIMDLLIENRRLVFPIESIIESSDGSRIQGCLNEKDYINDFLSHGFNKPVNIHIIQDSLKQKYRKLESSPAVSVVNYYITREEIEEVHLRKKEEWLREYQTFKNSKKNRKGGSKQVKPSTFFKNELGMKDIKSYDTVYNLWKDDIDGLVAAIESVRNDMSRRKKLSFGQHYLADIIGKQWLS